MNCSSREKLIGDALERRAKTRSRYWAIAIRPAVADEIRMIEDVERLDSQVEPHAFRQREWPLDERLPSPPDKCGGTPVHPVARTIADVARAGLSEDAH
jgi:hypothetical protein